MATAQDHWHERYKFKKKEGKKAAKEDNRTHIQYHQNNCIEMTLDTDPIYTNKGKI